VIRIRNYVSKKVRNKVGKKERRKAMWSKPSTEPLGLMDA
jgi:hypothetical protein